jgi:hypothetical protein
MGLPGHTPDFWTATAAAAPVIALAGLVAITDAAVAGEVLRKKKRQMIKAANTRAAKKQARKGFRELIEVRKPIFGPQHWWVIIYSIVNLPAQGFVLIVALWTLLHDRAPVSGTFIIVLEIIGLSFLLLATLLAAQVGRQRQRLEEAEKDDDAKKLAQYIATESRKPQQELLPGCER